MPRVFGARWLALLALLALPVVGCGGAVTAPSYPPPDAAAARAVLDHALRAWLAKEPLSAYQTRDPAARIIDDDWHAGTVLLRFGDIRMDLPHGPALRCVVPLELRPASGPIRKCDASYLVTIQPQVQVLRQDD